MIRRRRTSSTATAKTHANAAMIAARRIHTFAELDATNTNASVLNASIGGAKRMREVYWIQYA